MPSEMSFEDGISKYASTISKQQLGLVYHRPEMWAKPTRCFENVNLKIERAGGRFQPGWMFHPRRVADIPGPGYVIFCHHAVWVAPDGNLFDVTPFHGEEKHQPFTVGDCILFLLHDDAKPIVINKRITALASKFFPLTDDERMLSHIRFLQYKEYESCKELYAAMRDLPEDK